MKKSSSTFAPKEVSKSQRRNSKRIISISTAKKKNVDLEIFST